MYNDEESVGQEAGIQGRLSEGRSHPQIGIVIDLRDEDEGEQDKQIRTKVSEQEYRLNKNNTGVTDQIELIDKLETRDIPMVALEYEQHYVHFDCRDEYAEDQSRDG